MKLLFVYNANAGIAAGIMDSIHKTVSDRKSTRLNSSHVD